MDFANATNDYDAAVFLSRLSGPDAGGCAEAASAMETAAGQQPSYRDFVSARGADGVGIAVSSWEDEAAAAAWRKNSDHLCIIARGQETWYDAYLVAVATVTLSYDWQRPGG